MGFQTSVNFKYAIGVAGDFATSNPVSSYPTGEAQFVADEGGAVVGHFCWIDDTGLVSNTGTGKPDGFIHREQQALITTYLGEAGNVIPEGFPVTVMISGDYFVKSTVASAERKEKAFAKLSDGSMQPGAAGATIAGYVETDFVITVGCGLNELAVMSL